MLKFLLDFLRLKTMTVARNLDLQRKEEHWKL